MGWKEFLRTIRLDEIKSDVKIKQGGLVNVKVEKTRYHLYLQDSERVKKVQKANITSELEDKIKKEVEKYLAPLGKTLNAVSVPFMKQVVVSTIIALATDVIGAINATLAPITASVQGTVVPPLIREPKNLKNNPG